MTLEEFHDEISRAAENFRFWWLDEHDKNPGAFPLEFPDDNAGMWYEQFRWYFEGRQE